MINDNEINNYDEQNDEQNIEKRKSQNITFNELNKKRETLMLQKRKDFFKNKKATSMRNIKKENKKINININHNININANINQIKRDKEFDNNSSHFNSKLIEKDLLNIKNSLGKDKFDNQNIDNNNNENLDKKNNQNNKKDKQSKTDVLNNKNVPQSLSTKIDKLLLKQLKVDTKDDGKQEQFIEFFINNNSKNEELYDLKDNSISTTKYNIFTFIPKGLLYQFSRLSNVYFLFTAIIQSIPLISPLTSLTAIIPLIFVLGVSMIREAIEDLVRNNYDNLNNGEEVIVFRNNKFIKSTSKTLNHGEIVLVYENHNIPADMILIDTGFGEGTCYVETSSLDGEKTLKLKVANKYTQGFISNDIKVNKGIEKLIQSGQYSFDGFVKINAPNANLNYINGSLYALFSKDYDDIDHNINISINEFLLKGSILKNTNWIIGIVVYTGMNNKIILNSKKPRLKMSKIEKKLNLFLVFIFFVLMICCAECSLYHHFHYQANKKFYDNFIFISNSSNTESFIIFFTYFLLLNTMIPISLIVSTEIIKMIQGIFISWDILLYSKWRHCFCNVKTVSIIEELGNVNFIFSDKTGTLTKNQLEFKYCIIENKYYEYIKIGENSIRKESNQKKNSTNTYDMFKVKGKYQNKKNSFISENNQLLKNKAFRNKIIESNNQLIKKNNYNIQTENVNMALIYKKLSSQNVNRFKLAKDDKSIFNSQSHSNSPPSPKSPKSKKDKNKVTKNNEYNFSYNKNKHKNHSNVSIVSINNNSNNINTNSNRTDTNNSHSNSSNSHNERNKNNSIANTSNINKVEEILKKQNNSTILEAKNEENESNSMANEIIKFGEGFFIDYDNNQFLNNVHKNNSLNYIHEFWVALALTNECMIKYEKGELKYMGTSPDDLELVKTASSQGYKLIDTSIDTKTIRIAGKNHSFEILKVLGFSSERKRMSIIVKDNNEIKLYTKGADCEISKRLSKRSLENENFELISNGLIEFSKKGLRTLMVAYRKINEEDYYSWVSRLHEDEFNMQNKQKLIERLYDIIENNLILLGGTVVEDKLQENVPNCIKELRSAGIKLWVLTGDKLDTAENIGYSCNLLSKEQKLFTLKLLLNEDIENNKEEPFLAINQFFLEFQEFIEQLVKKYNLDSKYNKKNYNNDNNSNNVDINSDQSQSQHQSDGQQDKNSKSSNSSMSKIIDFEKFYYLKEKNILEPFSIIIESPILAELFTDEEYTYNFIRIAYYSNTVICCRISPSQKSEVVNKIKNFDNKAITLAIGDGGNDVSMIMEANIGIGIHGEEGTSAAQASDFSIGEFQILKRLLFIHGRINLYRISKMILYFFFKNFIFTMNQFYFSFLCLASGQTIIDDWYITCYNLLFTAFPLCVRAITDSDIDLNDKKNTKKNLAILYKENRDKYKIFSFKNFIWKLAKAMVISLLLFILCSVKEIFIDGYNNNIWYMSLKCYISILIIVSLNILINSSFIVYLLPVTIGISTFLFFFIFLILNHYGIFFEFNSKASIFTSLRSPLIYLSIFFICSFHFIIDYSSNLFKLFLRNSLINKLILKKSCSSSNKANSSKANSRNSKNKDVCSSHFDDRSRNILLSKSMKTINKLRKINNNRISYFNNNNKINPKIYNHSKSKFGESFKNEFYSLKILKSINNNNNNIVNNNDDNSNNFLCKNE